MLRFAVFRDGKELQDDDLEGVKLGWYDYGFRFYDPVIGRWYVQDKLAEKYYSIAPYVYCSNNPIKLIDIDGLFFDDKNEKRAQRLEKRLIKKQYRLAKKVVKMAAKGKDTRDIEARQDELDKSLNDINDMRGDNNVEYRYASANSKSNPAGKGKPNTDGMNSNVVTLYTENTMGSKLHEGRHGGDIARGTLTISNYGVQDEVSAYKAQYSWKGTLQYRDQPNQAVMLQRMMAGQDPTTVTITNINQINRNVVNSMVDPGFVPIYPPRNANGVLIIPLNIWNKN